jgi:predicted transcriptional regulator
MGSMQASRALAQMTHPALAPLRAAADEAMAWRTPSIDADATVGDARELVRRSGQRVLLVTSGSLPVGVITKGELWSAGAPLRSDSRVQDAMHLELVRITPESDVDHTLRRYEDAAWSSLFRRGAGRRPREETRCTS